MFQLLGGFFPVSDEIKWLNKRETNEVTGIRNSVQKTLRFYEMIDNKICKGKIADTSTLPDYLDEPFKRILNKVLHPDYKKRFQSSSEFLKAIHSLERFFPSYKKTDDYLHVIHSTGRECKIYKNMKNEYVLEKRFNNKIWRKDNGHTGNYKSVLQLARNK